MNCINQKYFSTETSKEVKKEIQQGLDLLKEIQVPLVTFFGSHIGKKGQSDYDLALEVSQKISEKGYAVMSGGGPGIMHAANTGAKLSGMPSIGVMADLLEEERIKDDIFTHRAAFKYMFVRRFILSIKSEALIFFPGGYGTLNELFEFVVLMQTAMVEKVPIILVNNKFWKGMRSWIESLPDLKMINKKDLKLLHYADDVDEVLKIITKNKVRK